MKNRALGAPLTIGEQIREIYAMQFPLFFFFNNFEKKYLIFFNTQNLFKNQRFIFLRFECENLLFLS